MAVKLGRVNVEAMLRSLTARQFLEWMAYGRLEPFGELRADYRAASVAQMVFNMAVAVKDRKALNDFLLKWGEEKKPQTQTWQQKKAIAYAICMAYSKPAKDLN